MVAKDELKEAVDGVGQEVKALAGKVGAVSTHLSNIKTNIAKIEGHTAPRPMSDEPGRKETKRTGGAVRSALARARTGGPDYVTAEWDGTDIKNLRWTGDSLEGKWARVIQAYGPDDTKKIVSAQISPIGLNKDRPISRVEIRVGQAKSGDILAVGGPIPLTP